MVATLSKRWWVFLIKGIAAIIFGILAFAWPGMTILTLTIIFGAYAFVNGVMALAAAVGGLAGTKWWALLLEALISLIVAFFVWDQPVMSAVTLVYAVGFWAVLTGILEVIAGVQLRETIVNEWLYVLAGVVSIIFGVWVLRNPVAGALAIVWVIGIYAIVFGILQIFLSLRLNGLKSAAHPIGS
jgi:uncharacterized membrane protein HdeD (DUF308 family)